MVGYTWFVAAETYPGIKQDPTDLSGGFVGSSLGWIIYPNTAPSPSSLIQLRFQDTSGICRGGEDGMKRWVGWPSPTVTRLIVSTGIVYRTEQDISRLGFKHVPI
ncbi:hypothetical protein DSO57_1030368 [Entomophthora muscae]|uniref:Uncharacterized protein n=1 Tax=Entomophthora muscae TaxID=34485 RepID=A0ACC2SPX8_9FUNG|nr:hypothetical protein DSO57_1030368 [Entomophthora muscae]